MISAPHFGGGVGVSVGGGGGLCRGYRRHFDLGRDVGFGLFSTPLASNDHNLWKHKALSGTKRSRNPRLQPDAVQQKHVVDHRGAIMPLVPSSHRPLSLPPAVYFTLLVGRLAPPPGTKIHTKHLINIQ